MWQLHYKSDLGSFMEEEYATLGEMYEAMDSLYTQFNVKSFRVRFVPKEK